MRARTIIAAAVASAAAVATLTATTAGAGVDELASVRTPTARYHSITQAEQAGYTLQPCP